MTPGALDDLTSWISPDVLTALRRIAESQGRQLQTVVHEALADYVEEHRDMRERPMVAATVASSLDEFDTLYRALSG